MSFIGFCCRPHVFGTNYEVFTRIVVDAVVFGRVVFQCAGLRRSQRPTPRSSIRPVVRSTSCWPLKKCGVTSICAAAKLVDIKPVVSLPASGDLIVVAANGSTLLDSLRDAIGYEPTEGQTLLKSVAADGRNILVVSGADADATLSGRLPLRREDRRRLRSRRRRDPGRNNRPIALRLRRRGTAPL